MSTAPPGIYPLSLHDALPISTGEQLGKVPFSSTREVEQAVAAAQTAFLKWREVPPVVRARNLDRKSTRLNSSHANMSYAVFWLEDKMNSHCALALHTARTQAT